MSLPILNNIHYSFEYSNTKGNYITAKKNPDSSYIFLPDIKKQTTPSEVFRTVSEYIKKELESQNTTAFTKTLDLLIDDGNLFYKRYEKKSGIFRTAAKIMNKIAYFFFPKFFNDKYEDARKETKAAYENYIQTLNFLKSAEHNDPIIAAEQAQKEAAEQARIALEAKRAAEQPTIEDEQARIEDEVRSAMEAEINTIFNEFEKEAHLVPQGSKEVPKKTLAKKAIEKGRDLVSGALLSYGESDEGQAVAAASIGIRFLKEKKFQHAMIAFMHPLAFMMNNYTNELFKTQFPEAHLLNKTEKLAER